MSVVGRLLDRRLGPGQPLRVLSASGQLGNGIPEAALQAGLAREPHAIGCDMGSIDPGPYYLGAGRMATSPAITRRDLRLAILGARQARVPLLIGTAGTAGAAPHVAATLDLIRGIVREAGISLRIAVIHADMDRAWLKAMAAADRIRAIGAIGALTAAEIDGAAHIVGQMGTEAFLRALAMEPDVILAGRACDTAVFAAVPLLLGYPAGPATHMAKIIECTSLCCTPGGRDAMLGTLHGDHFDLESMNPARAATPLTVAAHSLYEQADPLHVQEPDGTLNVAAARFEALDDRRVRVHGATWTPATQPSIKIEGSTLDRRARRPARRHLRPPGDRTPCRHHRGRPPHRRRDHAGRDLRPPLPRLWQRRHQPLPRRRAAMPTPGELFFLVECIAATAELAKAVVGVAKQNLLHFGFPGRLSTGGNIAFPFTPPEIPAGPAYRFSAYHIAECDDLASAFPITLETLR